MRPFPPPVDTRPEYKKWFYDRNTDRGPIRANEKRILVQPASRHLKIEDLLAHAKGQCPSGKRCKLFNHFKVTHDPDRDQVTLTRLSRRQYGIELIMQDIFSFRC